MNTRIFAIIIQIILVILALGGAFNISGSPFEMQKITKDTQRLKHLSQISNKINTYYHNNNQLPSEIQMVTKNEQETIDPITKESIGYKIIDQFTYELCTTFEIDSEKIKLENIFYNQDTDAIEYSSGYNCIRLTVIDPTFRNNIKISPPPSPVVTIQSPPPTYAIKTETGLYMGKTPIPNSNPITYLIKVDVSNGRGQRIIDVKEPKGGVKNSNNQFISLDSMKINDTLFFTYTIDTDDQFIATEMIDKSL